MFFSIISNSLLFFETKIFLFELLKKVGVDVISSIINFELLIFSKTDTNKTNLNKINFNVICLMCEITIWRLLLLISCALKLFKKRLILFLSVCAENFDKAEIEDIFEIVNVDSFEKRLLFFYLTLKKRCIMFFLSIMR